MNDYLIYLTKVGCVLGVLFSVYYLLLRVLSFHSLNRILLLLIMLSSFLIPLIRLGSGPVFTGELKITEFTEFAFDLQATANRNTDSASIFSAGYLICLIYWAGFAVFVSRFVLTAFSLIRLKRNSPCRTEDGFQFISAGVPSIFSCFNWIFLPKPEGAEYEKAILEHEKAHANFGHTVDLILTEICIALLWFNPFVYFFQKALKTVHEFQADAHVLRGNVSKSHYLKLMCNALEAQNTVGVYSYFNRLTIKNRVIMISTRKSHKSHLIKYFIFLPLLAGLVLAFSNAPGTPPAIFPLKAEEYHKITQVFGKEFVNPITKKETVHGGIDISAEAGVAVLATGDGIIKSITEDEGWGKLLIIDHGEGFETWYAHLQGFNVSEGQQVKRGETIAFVGNTGYSTGPHLHYEVRLNGERVDPMDYVEKKE